nr:hypothetical protein [uncultured Flavobacterium sp.]
MKIYYSKISLFIVLNCFLLFACSGSNSEEALVYIKPTNLIVTPAIVGATTQTPNSDGSGVVNFALSATNATKYKIVLGNGETKEITNGSFTYTYTTSGSNTYVLYVSAYNTDQFVSTTLSITVLVQPNKYRYNFECSN